MCGDGRSGHPLVQGHIFIPTGCTCSRSYLYPKTTSRPDGRGQDRAYIGVYRNGGKWEARISGHYLGAFTTARYAAAVRDEWILTHGLPHPLAFPKEPI